MKPSSSTVPGRAASPWRAPAVTSDGAFSGYASLFGVEDQGHDVVMPGAFGLSLAKRGAHGIRMLFQHDPAQPIGAWEEIREDARGLFVCGRIIAEAARGADLLALMRGGALDGLSIGFRARRSQRDAATGQRRLYDIDLWEISIVTFPMLPGARVIAKATTAEAVVRRDASSVVAIPPSGLRWQSQPYPSGRRVVQFAPPRAPTQERRGARPDGGLLSPRHHRFPTS